LKIAARLVPETKKIRLVLEKAEEKHNEMYRNEEGEPTARLVEEEDYFLYTIKDHWKSEGVNSEKPVCNLYLGFFRYAVEWITGHPHEVEEVECRALGHPVDMYRIAKARKEA
jgi:predicted hydrocarbon binding protein